MTEISEAAKRKACELVNEAAGYEAIRWMGAGTVRFGPFGNALTRILQEHSDAGKQWAALLARSDPSVANDIRKSLILPDEPDTLADLRAVLKEMYGEMPPPDLDWGSALIDRVSKGLAQRGKAIKIVEADNE